MPDTTDTPTFAEWVILEILGHRRMAGYLTEQQIAGAGFLRLDIPAADGQGVVTQYYAPSSIYAIHPTTKAIAQHVAQTYRPAPVQHWELPAAEPAEPTYRVDGQPVSEESYQAWADEGRIGAADYGQDLDDEGNPF